MAQNEIRVFNSADFGKLNVLTINGEPWFIGSEVAEKLGYVNTRDAIRKRVHPDDRNTVALRDSNKRGNPNKVIINESGFYTLVMASTSQNEAVKRFQRWVTHDVIPAIRKHGAYMTPKTAQSILDNPDNAIILAKALLEEHEKRLAAEQQSEALQLTNSMLSQQINTWDERKVTNALIRAYGNRSCGGNFQAAWNTLYKRLEYKRGINIRSRRTKSSDDLRPLINFIRSSEWPAVLSVAASMCVESNLEPGEIIGPENVKRYLAA